MVAGTEGLHDVVVEEACMVGGVTHRWQHHRDTPDAAGRRREASRVVRR